MLNEIDAVDWAALSGAQGSAHRMPVLLRAVAAAAEPAAGQSFTELFDELYHQQTTWPVTGVAVPFLVEVASSPTAGWRGPILELLAELSRSSVRATVAEHLDRFPPLLHDPDPTVRSAAAYVLAWHDAAAEPSLAALLARWEVEREPLARASVLAAMGALDPDVGRTTCTAALHDPEPAVRAAAGLVLLWMRDWWPKAKIRWPKAAPEAVASAFSEDDPLVGWAWTGDPLGELLEHFEDRAVPEPMLGLLARSADPDNRSRVATLIGKVNEKTRSAPARLLPVLERLLADPDEDVRDAAARTAHLSGLAAAGLADRLTELAAAFDHDGPARAGVRAGEWAVDTLINLGDPRWRPVLFAAWRRTDRTGWRRANISPETLLLDNAVPGDDELLSEIRSWLANALRPGERLGGARMTGLDLLESWGAVAAPAVPEVLALLQRELAEKPGPGYQIAVLCRTLAAIDAGRSAPVVAAVRTVASREASGLEAFSGALALWQLAADPAPLLATVDRHLEHSERDCPAYAWLPKLSALGEALTPLVPRLRRHLTEHPDRLRTRLAIAELLWERHADLVAQAGSVYAQLHASWLEQTRS